MKREIFIRLNVSLLAGQSFDMEDGLGLRHPLDCLHSLDEMLADEAERIFTVMEARGWL